MIAKFCSPANGFRKLFPGQDEKNYILRELGPFQDHWHYSIKSIDQIRRSPRLEQEIIEAGSGDHWDWTRRSLGLKQEVLQTESGESFLETLEQVHGKRKDDGWVLLSCDGVEGLEVAQLQSGRRRADDVSSLLQAARCLVLSFCCYHLQTWVSCMIYWYIDNESSRLHRCIVLGFCSCRYRRVFMYRLSSTHVLVRDPTP